MLKSEKKWKVYLIHHSHTDIGYTQQQEKIMRYHYDFIRQVMQILDERAKEEKPSFIWQCENYWQVENFYEMADEKEKASFETYVRSGKIGLSGNYLNMTELVSAELLRDGLDRMKAFGERIGQKITSGMCADINGMAWGYSELLYQYGVDNLYSCLHPHHGMFPLYQKVCPFFWKTPEGNKLLVWNGDHYHLGNELFLAPHGGTTYMIRDEFSAPIVMNQILNQNEKKTEEEELKICTIRMERYLSNLEEEGYDFDFVPLIVSGAITDNAPPGSQITERINKLNFYYNGAVVFEMVTLDTFFKVVREKEDQIPCYEGDFTDWWADGVGSTPAEVKLYKDTVRKYSLCGKLMKGSRDELSDSRVKHNNRINELSGGLMELANKQLMLYAEHTWGYSSSVSEPWESLVSMLELKKGGYAVQGHHYVSRKLDQLLAERGEVSIRQDKPQVYKILNPHSVPVRASVNLFIEFWEYIEGCRYDESLPIEVVDCLTGLRLPCQVKGIARAVMVETAVEMQPGEEKKVRIQLKQMRQETTKNHAHIGAEGVEDLLRKGFYREDLNQIETDFFLIQMNASSGICSIRDKVSGKEIIRSDSAIGAFAGIYEYTPMKENACETRRSMGRGRRNGQTKQFKSILTGRKIIENGELYLSAELQYELEGTKMYTVFFKVYKQAPKIVIMVRIHKESRWEPENLYVALPFTAGDDAVTYIDKTGCIIRPGIDQLPGSCQDFYLIQNGVVWKTEDRAIMLTTKDAPLITMGDLLPKPVLLCSGEDWNHNKAPVYSWVMNNYWETNFKVNLGGFYEFAYTLTAAESSSEAELFRYCEAENEGLISFYTE